MRYGVAAVLCCAGVLALAAMRCGAQDPVSDPAQLAEGKVLVLGEGTVKLGDLKLPKGSAVKGAGVGKTIVDASGHDAAFIVDGVAGVSINDLTITNAASAGVRIVKAQDVRLDRVRICGAREGRQSSLRVNVDLPRCRGCAKHAPVGHSGRGFFLLLCRFRGRPSLPYDRPRFRAFSPEGAVHSPAQAGAQCRPGYAAV